ncbi:hypothetical protein LTR35_001796 [Friedmanniomyces endolithicus]|nr:hypothetical protein LTR35_001796 [Friedmanniomyces endolithicus]KAK0296882.1 hypothetical protein LTS00_004682 [Friedmanniomyces endolithicus]KAK1011121.1 hypothetical protein LTR54_005039 [Friedmanniomyces endolithicus]
MASTTEPWDDAHDSDFGELPISALGTAAPSTSAATASATDPWEYARDSDFGELPINAVGITRPQAQVAVTEPWDNDDSSDTEFVAPVNPYASAGARSLQYIMREGPALRDASKKASKGLLPVHGAPGTAYLRSLWKNRWEAYYTLSLKKSINTMPTEADFERFILCLPDICSTEGPQISWSTAQTAVRYGLCAIRCRHEAFRQTTNGRGRVEDVFETLRQAGKLTREPKRDKQWVSARLISCLTRGLLVEAVQGGTTDWSWTIQQCLGLSLQSAMSSRAGDIAKSGRYGDDECLLFQDIKLKITVKALPTVGGPPVALLDRVDMHATFTLRHTKGYKRDGHNNHVVSLRGLDDDQPGSADALQLLVIHALRQGAIRGATSAEDVVGAVDPAGYVQWTFPGRPVLVNYFRLRPDYTKAASTIQLLSTLQKAAAASGIAEKLVTQDIRRGSALDASELRPGPSLTNAAAALNHSGNSAQKGITKAYVGHGRASTYAERLELPQDIMGLKPAAPQALHKVARIGGAENVHDSQVVTVARSNGLGSNRKSSAFTRAGQDEGLRLGDVRADHKRPALRQLSANKSNARGAVSGEGAGDNDGDDDGEFDVSNVDPALRDFAGFVGTFAYHDSDTANDDQMSAQTQRLSDVLQDLEYESDTLNISLDSTANSGTPPTAAELGIPMLIAPRSVFVSFMSSINTYVRYPTSTRAHDTAHLNGGSRDECTAFIFYCKNRSTACLYKATVKSDMTAHEKTCTPARAALMSMDTVVLECDFDQCDFIAKARDLKTANRKLREHNTRSHKVTLKCPTGGRPSCSDMFSIEGLRSHTAREHKLAPSPCPVGDCPTHRPRTMFTSREGLRKHLARLHPTLTLAERLKFVAVAIACKSDEVERK